MEQYKQKNASAKLCGSVFIFYAVSNYLAVAGTTFFTVLLTFLDTIS